MEQLGGEEELGELEHMLKCRELSDRLWCGKKKKVSGIEGETMATLAT